MPINDHLNHKPDEEGISKCEKLRLKIIELDDLIQQEVVNSREKSIALTKLEECRMWAIKGVVIGYPAQEINQ